MLCNHVTWVTTFLSLIFSISLEVGSPRLEELFLMLQTLSNLLLHGPQPVKIIFSLSYLSPYGYKMAAVSPGFMSAFKAQGGERREHQPRLFSLSGKQRQSLSSAVFPLWSLAKENGIVMTGFKVFFRKRRTLLPLTKWRQAIETDRREVTKNIYHTETFIVLKRMFENKKAISIWWNLNNRNEGSPSGITSEIHFKGKQSSTQANAAYLGVCPWN